MTKEITINYNEHCAVLDAVDRLEQAVDMKELSHTQTVLKQDHDYTRLKTTLMNLRNLAKKWNATQ